MRGYVQGFESCRRVPVSRSACAASGCFLSWCHEKNGVGDRAWAVCWLPACVGMIQPYSNVTALAISSYAELHHLLEILSDWLRVRFRAALIGYCIDCRVRVRVRLVPVVLIRSYYSSCSRCVSPFSRIREEQSRISAVVTNLEYLVPVRVVRVSNSPMQWCNHRIYTRPTFYRIVRRLRSLRR